MKKLITGLLLAASMGAQAESPIICYESRVKTQVVVEFIPPNAELKQLYWRVRTANGVEQVADRITTGPFVHFLPFTEAEETVYSWRIDPNQWGNLYDWSIENADGSSPSQMTVYCG